MYRFFAVVLQQLLELRCSGTERSAVESFLREFLLLWGQLRSQTQSAPLGRLVLAQGLPVQQWRECVLSSSFDPIDFDIVYKHCSDIMIEQKMYPERYFVEEFPTKEKISLMTEEQKAREV